MSSPRVVPVPAERLEGWTARFTRRHGDLERRRERTDLVLQAADGSWARLTPPFLDQLPQEADVAALVRAVTASRRSAVLAVRRGGFACAVVEADDVVASKASRRYVQGRTAAGGWSQQRFARRRDKQTHELVVAAADAVARVVLPHPPWDGLLTGGDVPLVEEVLSDDRLAAVAVVPRGLPAAVGDPDATWVRSLPQRLRTVRVTVLDVTR